MVPIAPQIKFKIQIWLQPTFLSRETNLLLFPILEPLGSIFFFFFNKFILFIYFWLRWVFVAARGLSLLAVSGGYSLLWCVGFSLQWLLLRSTGFRHVGSVVVARRLWSAGSVVVVHRFSCSVACGVFPDQGSNPCPLHWQADS